MVEEANRDNDLKFDIGEGAAANSDDEEDFLNGGGGRKQEAAEVDTGVIVDLNQIQELWVTKKNKVKEEHDRKARIEECSATIKALMKKIKQ